MALCIYIKDGHHQNGNNIDFIDLILDGLKKYETRNHNRLKKGWIGIAKNGMVYGKIYLGKPILQKADSKEYFDSYIDGTEYDILGNEEKYFYPIEGLIDFRDDPKPIVKNGNYGQYAE